MKICPQANISGEIVVRSEPFGMRMARKKIVSVAGEMNFDPDATNDILLAVGEAVANACVHGSSEPGISLIYLGWHCRDDTLTVIVKDDGCPSMPLSGWRVKTLGQGMRIMQSVMDSVEIIFDRGATVILKKQKLPGL
ncbi:MAG: ATP-binding protein [Armatimonadota bacterium]|nr:ATP-binding protein [bacterium]